MDMPPDQYELYAEFGIASEKAQVLEVAAGNVALSYVLLFVNTDKITPEETEMFRNLVDDINRRTFGYLLSRLKKMFDIDDSIVKTIDKALERRNHLTHHFFRSHNYALYSEEGRKAMIAELKEIQKDLGEAHSILEAIASNLDAFAGRKTDAATGERLVARGKKINI